MEKWGQLTGHPASCFLHSLGYGRKGGKVRFNADFPVLVEPFHHDIRERLPTAALPGPNDVGPAPLGCVEDSLDDLLADGDEDALAGLILQTRIRQPLLLNKLNHQKLHR
eukprot:2485244-Pleurochrysis_carterae.AAC.1